MRQLLFIFGQEEQQNWRSCWTHWATGKIVLFSSVKKYGFVMLHFIWTRRKQIDASVTILPWYRHRFWQKTTPRPTFRGWKVGQWVEHQMGAGVPRDMQQNRRCLFETTPFCLCVWTALQEINRMRKKQNKDGKLCYREEFVWMGVAYEIFI